MTKHGMVLVECKHHSKHGVYTGLKESLYTHARFLDTKPYFDRRISYFQYQNFWLMQKNMSSALINRFYLGNILQIIVWKKLLKKTISYPITILNITSKEITIFANQRILLIKHILDYTEH